MALDLPKDHELRVTLDRKKDDLIANLDECPICKSESQPVLPKAPVLLRLREVDGDINRLEELEPTIAQLAPLLQIIALRLIITTTS